MSSLRRVVFIDKGHWLLCFENVNLGNSRDLQRASLIMNNILKIFNSVLFEIGLLNIEEHWNLTVAGEIITSNNWLSLIDNYNLFVCLTNLCSSTLWKLHFQRLLGSGFLKERWSLTVTWYLYILLYLTGGLLDYSLYLTDSG